jgi:hypothetical protein
MAEESQQNILMRRRDALVSLAGRGNGRSGENRDAERDDQGCFLEIHSISSGGLDLLADSLPIVELNLRKRVHARQWAAGTNSARTEVPSRT